jgi:hypothetical protein
MLRHVVMPGECRNDNGLSVDRFGLGNREGRDRIYRHRFEAPIGVSKRLSGSLVISERDDHANGEGLRRNGKESGRGIFKERHGFILLRAGSWARFAHCALQQALLYRIG